MGLAPFRLLAPRGRVWLSRGPQNPGHELIGFGGQDTGFLVMSSGATDMHMTTGRPVGKWRPSTKVALKDEEEEEWIEEETPSPSADSEEDETSHLAEGSANTRKEGEFIVGGGALRGEQEFYSVKDLQASSFPSSPSPPNPTAPLPPHLPHSLQPSCLRRLTPPPALRRRCVCRV